MDEKLRENLRYLGLTHMAKVFDELALRAAENGAQPADLVADLVAGEAEARRTRAVERRIRHAGFPVVKTIDDFDWAEAPFLQRGLIEYLFRLDFVRERRNVVFIGSPGTGKTHLATALGHQACLCGFHTAYYNLNKLFEQVTIHRVEASLLRFFDKLAATDLLIIDDFGMKALDGQQLLDFLEIIEDRHGRKATIIVSQLPVADWYDVLQGNTTAADAILDRIVHTAIRFELKGESMRK